MNGLLQRVGAGVRRLLTLSAAAALLSPAALAGQNHVIHAEGYLEPPPELAALVDAPRHDRVLLTNLAPDGRFFLNTLSDGPPPLGRLAAPGHRLAGLFVDPAAHRSMTLTTRGSRGLELTDARSGRSTTVRTPAGARISGARWSPDGGQVAFLASYPRETHVYVADTATGQSRRVTRTPLLATRVTSVEWAGDSRHLFAVVVPDGRGAEPTPPAWPTTPLIRVATPDENRLRTFPSLLKDPHEAELFEHHTTGQLIRIDTRNRRVHRIGAPAMIESVDAAPSGDYIRVRTTQKPFSWIVPASRFGDLDEIWDLEGRSRTEIRRREARDGRSDDDDGDDEPARRFLTWRADGQGLSFVQKDPEPEEGQERNRRMDRVFQWRPPFDDHSVVEVYAASFDIRAIRYSPDLRWLFLTERSRGTERLRAVHLDDPATVHTLYEWQTDAFRENPGSLMTLDNALGVSVVRMAPGGEHVFLSGTQYFEDPAQDAPRPFIDRVAIRTGEKERLFQSSPEMFERVAAVLDDELQLLVLTREAPTTVPDSWLLDRRTGDLRRLTSNSDPHPELTHARRERLTVIRADGIRFKMDVTFPPDYREGSRLPAMFWFYPREYADQDSYDESTRTHNRNRFRDTGPRSIEMLAVRGYLVARPDHPIIGPLGRVNDNYVVDLRHNHAAAIDALDRRGWIDRGRLALGGHSYGGFGTINAMVQTPFFRAGIAGAPNSNRLLTPSGFQRERRALWDARESYLEMSPFLWAERLSGALLIYHGEEDQNTGTWPDNSWRLIHALDGLGKTAALYMYPHEDHGPVARETLLDLWARWSAWLDHYVRDADLDEPVRPVPPGVVADDEAPAVQRR
jgi:dipeptidyl aminopeptidase/acylaminoacyl peptidase